MSTVTITCPACGFAKEIPAAKLPAKEVKATCPKCKHNFPLSSALSITAATVPRQAVLHKFPQNAPAPAPEVNLPAAATDAPIDRSNEFSPEPFRKPSIAELPIQGGGTGSKTLLLIFILIIVLLLGVRLWADGKKRSVPFPNFIATSAQGVAVSWGQDVYFLDKAGRVVRKQGLPKDVILTQLKFVGEELWVADYAAKAIKRIHGDALETVVNGAGIFRGAFKFVANTREEQIFVADSSNHKVHVFSIDGKRLKTFGVEGKGPAELMFPNTIVFDENDDLLIVNTNAHRLDIYGKDGEFVRSFAKVEAMEHYRFPTLLTQLDDRVAFLLTVDLRKAKVVMYGNDGSFLGEMVPPRRIEESGDVAVLDRKVLVSDNKERKIYQFSADTLAYLGPFSAELDAVGVEASRLESRYARLANASLYLMLVMSVPAFFLYLRMRRNDQRRTEIADYSAVVPREAIWGAETDRRKLVLALLTFVLAQLLLLLCARTGSLHVALIVSFANAGCIIMFFRLLMESGYANLARTQHIEKLLKTSCTTIARILASGEKVEICTVLQRSPFLKLPCSLLLLTNRRMIILDFNGFRLFCCRHLGYGDIVDVAVEPVKSSSGFIARWMRAELYRLKLGLRNDQGDPGPQFAGQDRQTLERLQIFLRGKQSVDTALGYCDLCIKCFRPTEHGSCPACRIDKLEFKPLILSLMYPGFGQFYNREILNGTLMSAFFSAGIITLTIPVIKMVDRSAEFTSWDVNIVVQDIFTLFLVYVVSVADADQVRRRGRKLFSKATGRALTEWLRRKLEPMDRGRTRLLLELVPGLGHAVSGKYLRGILWLIPFSNLLWISVWSFLTIATDQAGSSDFVVFEYCTALTAALWVMLNLDGICRQKSAQKPSLTVRSCLITIGLPFISLLAGLLAQMLREYAVEADPALRQAIQVLFRRLAELTGTEGRGSVSYASTMFLGWGGAIMAMMGVMSWQARQGVAGITKSSIVGFVGGIVCWTVTATALGGIVGSLSILPVLFGSVIGLFLFCYFRKTGASPLLVPAIISGTVLGYAVLINSSPVVNHLHPLFGGGTTRILMVAFPVYFIHLAALIVNHAVRQSER